MPKVLALVLSSHPIPGAAVTAIAMILAIGAGLEPWRVLVLGLAFALDQASVGLSNDWIDAERDRAVGRRDKPVALGRISPAAVRSTAFACAALSLVIAVPLGWQAACAHAVFLLSAWSYNIGLKRTPFSVLPYVVSFGLLPLVVTLALPSPAPASPWAMLAGALLGVSAHFANVLPDLHDDAVTGVRGLPHRAGRRASGLIIAGALGAASVSVVVGPGPAPAYAYVGLGLSVLLAVLCAVLVLRGSAPRSVFRLIILGALIDVVLLAGAGSRLLA